MFTALTINTQIPTAARGQLRSFIKGQPGFAPWLEKTHGILLTASARNAHLLEYAIVANLEFEVLQILNACAGVAPSANEIEDERIEGLLEGQPAAPAGSHDMATILAPVEPYLSSLVKVELEKALRPVIAAANKPAQVIEKETIVERFTVQNLSPLPAGALPYATKNSGTVNIGSLFLFRGQHAKGQVSTWDAHGAAPARDPYYVADALNMALLGGAIEDGINVWLTGPSGTGKSTMPEQFAAQTGRPCVKLGFTRQTEVADLIGGPAVLVDGSTQWQDGALIQAVKRPGTVIILDELTIAPAGVQAVIQLIADNHRSMTLPTGEKVVCAPGVVFIVADNTNGSGDQTGQYHGTNAANAALVNRFGFMLVIDYMSKADEAKALVNHTGCPRAAADHLAEFVARARKLPEMENMVLSLRQMVAFIKATKRGFAPKVCASVAFLNAMPATERAALETLLTLTWAGEFSALMGGAGPALPGQPDSPAARAFDDEESEALNRA